MTPAPAFHPVPALDLRKRPRAAPPSPETDLRECAAYDVADFEDLRLTNAFHAAALAGRGFSTEGR